MRRPGTLTCIFLAALASLLTTTAPATAQTGCPVGAVCQAIDEPAVPAWLALANGQAYFTSQSFEGVVADEYGSTVDADDLLYSKSVAYEQAPRLTSRVVDAVLVDLDGTGPGSTSAFVLQHDRTLSVLGPQMDGYPRRAADVTVPGDGALLGLTALASPSGANKRVIVVTADGFYSYDWTGNALALQAGMPTTKLPLARPGFFDYSDPGDPAFGDDAPPLSPSQPYFQVPDGEQVLGVHQAPPAKGTVRDLTSTFALAYTGSSRGPGAGTVSVIVFGLDEDGLHALNRFEAAKPDTSTAPVAVRYATARTTSGTRWHVGVLATATAGPPRLTTLDTRFTASFSSPQQPTLIDGAATVACPAAAGNALPALAVDLSLAYPAGTANDLGSTASVCAARTGDGVRFHVQRADLVYGTPDTELIHSSSESPATLDLPDDAIVAGVSVGFPCAQVLKQFADRPLNGFPDTSTNPNYCNNRLTPDTEIPQTSTGQVMSPRSSLAVQLQTIDGDALRLSSVSYPTPGGCIDISINTVGCDNDTPLTNTTQKLLDVEPGDDVTILPLDPSRVTLDARMITDSSNEVIRVPAAQNPWPVALMAAPPYYAGGEQQVTPTSTTFSSEACSGSSTTNRNQAGIFGGLSVEWASGKYEVEALVKLSAEWNHEIAHDTCSGWEQEFQAGNFGNNYTADNSLLYRVDSGVNAYAQVLRSSLGTNLTPDCDADHLANCHPLFVPNGSQYVLQTINQLRHPQPNNVYAKLNDELESKFGDAIEQALPDPGNPLSYPREAPNPPVGANACATTAAGPGSGNPGISAPNPFVEPTLPGPPNVLKAPQATAVNPASYGDEAGTVSTLTYDSSTGESSSTEFSLGGEASVKIVAAKLGASYEHGWGTETRQSFSDGTSFSGGVNDFQGFFNPYTYRLYQCRGSLSLAPAWGDGSVPVFLVNYMTQLVADQLPLNFVVPNLPAGTVDQDYDAAVFASGGVPGYTYSLTGGALPPGLRLNAATGQISGTPTADGTFSATVRAVDSAGTSAAEDIEIEILPELSLLDTLPDGEIGVAYDESLGISGGVAPYRILRTETGVLPPGLSLNNSSGRLQGTPTAPGRYCFGVYVSDRNFPNATITREPCVTIADALVFEAGSTLPLGEVGRPYTGEVCCARGGAAAFEWSVTGLPDGLTLDPATGEISGTPTEATSGGVDLQPTVRDAAGGEASGSAFLRIVAAPRIATETLRSTRVGEAYDEQINVTGGSGANTFALTGDAPPGLLLAPGTGRLSGTPDTAGDYTFTIVATDTLGGVAARTFSVRVDEPGEPAAPTITSDDTVTVAEGTPLAFRITTTGSPAATLSIDGALPRGVVFADSGRGSATLSGIPAPGTTGTYTLIVRATNSVGSADPPQAFTLAVTAPTTPVPIVEGIYVANAGDDSVTAYAADATGDTSPLWTLAGPATQLDEPSGVALDQQGALYVANAGNGTVTKYAAAASGDAAPVATLTGFGSSLGELTVGGDGSVYAATDVGVRIVAASGTATIPVAGGAAAVALDLDGSVFSANPGGSVTAFSALGHTPLRTLAGSGSELTRPAAIALDAAGQAFVADGGTVKRYAADADGSVPPLSTLTGLPVATGLALDPGGNTYVTAGDALLVHTAGAIDDAAATRELRGSHTGLDDPSAVFVAAAPWVRLQPTVDGPIEADDRIVLRATISAAPACLPQWQQSAGHGDAFTDMPGATGPTLTLDRVPAERDGYSYRATCANSFGSVTTDEVEISVRSGAAVAVDPVDVTVVAGGTARFEAASRGFPTPSVQWQRSAGDGAFVDVPGAVSPTLDITNVPASADGDRYRAVFENAGGRATTSPATLTVHYAPAVTAQPGSVDVVPGGSVTFSAAASGNPAPAVRWQISADGGLSFTDMAGATGPTVTIAPVSSVQSGYQVRAVFTNAVGSATSDAATLSVATAPVVVQHPTDVTVGAGEPAGFLAAASGSPAPAIQWQVSSDGVTFADIPGATGGELSVTAGAAGASYRARFTNIAGSVYSRAAQLAVRAVVGSPGPGPGDAGGGGVLGSSTGRAVRAGSIVSNASAAAVVKVRSTSLDVARTGRRARDVRVRLYCEPKAGRDCTGTIKLRTTQKVNPSTRGRKATPKKVTFITFAYSVPKGAVGVATARLSVEKMTLLRRLGRTRVDALVSVTDVAGKALIVKKTVPMRTVPKSR